jgi:site-specific recombinase XerC
LVLLGTRLAFNRIVVVRYRMHHEARGLAANTINQQLAAVRRLAYEAADAGLLSPELAAGIGRVNGVKQLGFRSGNWLSLDQSSEILSHALGEGLGAKRDYAMLAMLLGCGLRRSELADLDIDEVQTREGHWAIVDLIGKGGRIRTVPIPQWVKQALDLWISAAGITGGRVFRAVSKEGESLGHWNLPKRGVVRGQELLPASRFGPHGPVLLAEDVREAVSLQWRGA